MCALSGVTRAKNNIARLIKSASTVRVRSRAHIAYALIEGP